MIDIIQVGKSFNNHKVLYDLSLKIETGSTCVIIGRSGCGKSVLLKHIVGLMIPDEGKILVEGAADKVLADDKVKAVYLGRGKFHKSGV